MSQHLQVHAIPWYARQEKAAQEHAANGGMTGVARTVDTLPTYLYPVGMDGSMQLATAAQRCKNLDTIHGAKREECSGFPTVRANTSSSDGVLRVH